MPETVSGGSALSHHEEWQTKPHFRSHSQQYMKSAFVDGREVSPEEDENLHLSPECISVIKLQTWWRQKRAMKELKQLQARTLMPVSVRVLSAKNLHVKSLPKSSKIQVLVSTVRKPVGPLKFECLGKMELKPERDLEDIEEEFFIPGVSADYTLVVSFLSCVKLQEPTLGISKIIQREFLGQALIPLDTLGERQVVKDEFVIQKGQFPPHLVIDSFERPCSGGVTVEIKPLSSHSLSSCGYLNVTASDSGSHIAPELTEVLQSMTEPITSSMGSTNQQRDSTSPTSVSDLSPPGAAQQPPKEEVPQSTRSSGSRGGAARSLRRSLSRGLSRVIDTVKATQSYQWSDKPDESIKEGRYWFCLLEDKIVGYTSHDVSKPSCEIPLHSSTILLGSQRSETVKEGLRTVIKPIFQFHIQTEGRWYHFVADDAKSRERWLSRIDQVVQNRESSPRMTM